MLTHENENMQRIYEALPPAQQAEVESRLAVLLATCRDNVGLLALSFAMCALEKAVSSQQLPVSTCTH